MVTTGLGLACQEVGGAFHRLQYSSVAPVSPIYTVGGGKLIEHDGLWILVHHLSHVSQNVLLGDDAQEAPEQTRRGKQMRSEVTSGLFQSLLICSRRKDKKSSLCCSQSICQSVEN